MAAALTGTFLTPIAQTGAETTPLPISGTVGIFDLEECSLVGEP